MPASQLEVIKYAAKIMKINLPKYKNYKEVVNNMPDTMKRFWENNRRVDNSLLIERYGELLFPSYKEGLKYIYSDYLFNHQIKIEQ